MAIKKGRLDAMLLIYSLHYFWFCLLHIHWLMQNPSAKCKEPATAGHLIITFLDQKCNKPKIEANTTACTAHIYGTILMLACSGGAGLCQRVLLPTFHKVHCSSVH